MKNRFDFTHALELYRQAYLSTKADRTQLYYLTDLRQLGEYLAAAGVMTVPAVQRVHLSDLAGLRVGDLALAP